ncbi:restriction endonuclease subunit S [Vibrio parahaemolyticus]|nr:restriction endonuclease subunit S [Vibrio parahaemolyticus]
MGSNWETVCIDRIKSPQKYSCVGGPFGSSLSRKHYVDSGVPVIRGVNLSGDIFSESEFVFVSPEKSQELQRNMAFRGDLVFTQRGTLGQVALIPENSDYECYVVSQSQMKLTVDPTKADPYFIYSYFRSKEAKTLIEKSAIVGGVPHINLGILKDFRLRLPSLSVQQAVSKIAKDFDRKVMLNNQINQTLEQMAQAIFKSWFVDFDPVKAKMNGEQPEGMDAATASLFPEKLVESELGLIPEGWKVGTLKDIATFQNGYAFKGKDWTEEGFPVVKIGSVKPGIVDLKSCSYVAGQTVESLERFKLNIGDILVGMTGYVGETGLVPQSTVAPYLNQRVGRLTPLSQSRYELLYVIVRNTAYKQFAEAQAQGSAQANVSGKALMSYPIVIPSEKLIEKFSDLIAPMIKQKLTFSAQCEWLAQTRDTLLPKLLSGEIELGQSVEVPE